MRKSIFVFIMVFFLCSCSPSGENSADFGSENNNTKSSLTEISEQNFEPIIDEISTHETGIYPPAQEILSLQNATHIVELTRLEDISGSGIYLSADGNSAFFFGSNTITQVDMRSMAVLEVLEFESPLGAMALLPDGTNIAIVFQNGTVQVLGLPDLQILKSYHYQSETIPYSIAISPDGNIVATTQNNHIILWDLKSDAIIGQLEGHTNHIFSLQFTPDGNSLISGSMDYTINVWDVESESLIETISTDYEMVGKIAFSPNGSTFAIPLSDETSYGATLWTTDTLQPVRNYRGHEGNVSSTAYSPDGSILATSSFDGTIKLWDRKTGEELITLSGHNKNVFDVVFSMDGRMILSSSLDGPVIIWGINPDVTALSTASITSSPSHTETPAYTPTPGPINFSLTQSISVDNADKLALWRTLLVSSSQPIAFTPDGKYLVVVYDDAFHFWDYQEGIEVFSINEAINGIFQISPNSRQLLAEYAVYDLLSGEMVKFFLDEQHSIDCSKGMFSSTGQYAACVGHGVTIFNAKTWQILQSWLPEKGYANAALLSPDGRNILLSYPDGGIEVYDTLKGTLLSSLDENALPFFFSADGENAWLLHRPEDGYRRSVVVWDLAQSFNGVGINLSPSGYTALRMGSSVYVYDSGGKDNPVFVEFKSNKAPLSIELEQPNLYQAVLSPDLKLLAGFGDYGELQLWGIPENE